MSYIDWTCPSCGTKVRVRHDLPVHCSCKNKQPRGLPGTELAQIIPTWLARLIAGPDCGCEDYARQMNRWGVEGCEQRADEIVAHLVEASGAASKLAPTFTRCSAHWAVRTAIDRAQEKETKGKQNG